MTTEDKGTTTETAAEPTAAQLEQQQQEAEAGFAAGFKRIAGEPPAEGEASGKTDAEREAEEKASREAEAKAKAEADAKAAAEAAAADKAAYDALPKTLRDQMATLSALPKTVQNLAGHIGGLSQATQRIETALKAGKAATAAAGAEAPSDKQVAQAMADPEAFKRLEEDFPEWAGPVKAEFAAIRAELAKKQGGGPAVDVDALRRDFAGAVDQATNEAEERAFIRLKHPDWRQTVKTPEFRAWSLQGGPSDERYAEYKRVAEADPAKGEEFVNGFARDYPQWWADRGAAIFGSTADDAIKLLDGFKEHRKSAVDAEAARQKRQARLERAVTPRGNTAPATTAINDEQAFERGFARGKGK